MYKERMIEKLDAAFSPKHLEVRDDSAQHAGHSGARPEGETHFHVTIEADAFEGLSRVAAQRLVYKALKLELEEHVHALSLKIMS